MGYINTLLQKARDERKQDDKEEKEEKPEEENKGRILIEQYGNAKIYRDPKDVLYIYEVPTPRYRGDEKALVDTLMEITAGVTTIDSTALTQQEKRSKYFQKIIEIIDATPELKVPIHAKEFYANAVVREMVGLGLIDPLIQDDLLEEIMVIGPNKPVYVYHRKHEMMKTNIIFYDDTDIQNLIDRIARTIGRRIDISFPLLDARLKDGTRVNATLPPATVDGSTLTLRKFRKDPLTVLDLINYGTLDFETAAFLWLATDGMDARPANILVAGGTASGKTSTLNVLTSFVPSSERVISIEDTAELSLPLEHWVRMEVRPPSIEGSGEITMNDLVKNSLRMRPDRIIVGEIRGAEGYTMFAAMNTGHQGATTGESIIQLADGRIRSVKELADQAFSEGEVKMKGGFEYVEVNKPVKVLSLNKNSLSFEAKNITRVWRKETSESLVEVTLKSGKKILLTNDHPLYKIHEGVKEINAGSVSAGEYITIPSRIEISAGKKELFQPYLTGLLYGDGHVNEKMLNFVNACPELVNGFESALEEVSAHKVTVMPYESFTRAEIWDPNLAAKFNQTYAIPFGNKTKIFKLNDYLLTASNEELGKFLRGIYDCEASVNLKTKGVSFSTSNKDLDSKLTLLLMRYGIHSGKYVAEKDGKGHPGPYYTTSIYGKENVSAFADAIGFSHPEKSRKLSEVVNKAGPSQNDVLPNLAETLRKLRRDAGLTQTELAKRLGNSTRSVVRAYETGKRRLTRAMLLRICSSLKSEISEKLKLLAEAPLCFEEVKSVKIISFEGYVYDLTVEEHHNYIANGILVSNCMGTVHANSAQETLVRLANPPISVPNIMISALNFIVMQNRIHDRRRGTLRRVTEIAELVSVSEGKPEIQTLFQWDAIKDKLEPTGSESVYKQILTKFTGLSNEEITAELKEREQVLRSLSESGEKTQEKIRDATQDYILGKRGKV